MANQTDFRSLLRPFVASNIVITYSFAIYALCIKYQVCDSKDEQHHNNL